MIKKELLDYLKKQKSKQGHAKILYRFFSPSKLSAWKVFTNFDWDDENLYNIVYSYRYGYELKNIIDFEGSSVDEGSSVEATPAYNGSTKKVSNTSKQVAFEVDYGNIKVNMTAYDYLLSRNSLKSFNEHRQVLVNTRGTLSNGNLPTGLNIQYDKNKTENETLFTEDETEQQKILKIYQRVGRAQHPGIIFDNSGGEEVLHMVQNSGKITFNERLNLKISFMNQKDKDRWVETSVSIRKTCIAKNFNEMIKKTDVYYRTHGDRMHYLVNGIIKVKDSKGDTKIYPLFLFSCSDLNKKTLTASVEQTGFINFWVDKMLFENEIQKSNNNSIEINLDSDYAATSANIAKTLNSLNLSSVENITIDPTYVALSIITGFESEYIDPAWQDILGNETINES
ncbi:MAG: hypothetical protein ACI9BF_000811 [Candidatus Paceibacteria bacterium]|jgi:hypothetical protein